MAKQALSPWQRKQDDVASAREEKRLAVLKAGAAAFRERGFEKTSLDDIAGKLGVTKPTLYYYIENLLPAQRVKELRRNKRELNSVVIAMLERGIADGSIARCDTRLVSFALFGAFNWVARWHSGSSATTDRIAEVFMSLFSNGIAVPRS